MQIKRLYNKCTVPRVNVISHFLIIVVLPVWNKNDDITGMAQFVMEFAPIAGSLYFSFNNQPKQ